MNDQLKKRRDELGTERYGKAPHNKITLDLNWKYFHFEAGFNAGHAETKKLYEEKVKGLVDALSSVRGQLLRVNHDIESFHGGHAEFIRRELAKWEGEE